MDRLKREGNPPVGQLASPIPQYKKPGSTDYEAVEGQHGAPFAILKDASGNVVSPATEAKLEQVRVLLNSINSKDFATDAKLEQARVLLNSINSKDFATNAKLEEVRALLNTINGKDFATQAELVAVKQELQAIKTNQLSGDQKVQLSGANVVKQEVVLQRGIYSESTGRKILNKPPEARGLHLFCKVHGRTGTFGDGQGILLTCVFNRANLTSGVTSYGLRVTTDRTTSNYVTHHIFIGPGFVGLGDAEGEYANVKVSPMVLTTTLNFEVSILGTFGEGEGFDIDVTAVWVR